MTKTSTDVAAAPKKPRTVKKKSSSLPKKLFVVDYECRRTGIYSTRRQTIPTKSKVEFLTDRKVYGDGHLPLSYLYPTIKGDKYSFAVMCHDELILEENQLIGSFEHF